MNQKEPDLFGVGLRDATERKALLFRRNFNLIGDSVRGNDGGGFRGYVSFLIFGSHRPFQRDTPIRSHNFHVMSIGGKRLISHNAAAYTALNF